MSAENVRPLVVSTIAASKPFTRTVVILSLRISPSTVISGLVAYSRLAGEFMDKSLLELEIEVSAVTTIPPDLSAGI